MHTIEQDAERLFTAHSAIIRGCVDRFSSFARNDAHGRVALGFIPHMPEKYTLLSQMYQSVHQVLVGLYRIYKDGSTSATLNDWLGILQFDAELIRKNPLHAQVFSGADQGLLTQFDMLAHEVLAFRFRHLKEILMLARLEAERALHAGNHEATGLLEQVSDKMLDAVQKVERLRAEQSDHADNDMETRTASGFFSLWRRNVA